MKISPLLVISLLFVLICSGCSVRKEIGINEIVYSVMDNEDLKKLQTVFEEVRDYKKYSWTNPNTGQIFIVTPIKTLLYRKNKSPCRHVQISTEINYVKQNIIKIAFRDNYGKWIIK